MGNERSIPKPVDIVVQEKGNGFDYRIHALDKKETKQISLWHDVKLFPTNEARSMNIVNMICEIPRCSRKKYEIATNEPGNPIKQDVKKAQLREFAKGDVYFNYGCLPRTWEDPDHEHPDAKARGDNDPLDVCEIGLRIMKVAEVVPVKILGTLCLIDEGEADWKLIAISVDDPWALLLNDVSDLELKLPGIVSSIREWFRTYKIPDGKPPNKFALDEKCMDANYAMAVVDATHDSWKMLVTGSKDEIYSDEKDEILNRSNKSSKSSHPSSGDTYEIKRNLSYPKLNLTDLSSI